MSEIVCLCDHYRAALEFIAAHADKTLICPSMGADFDRGHQTGANKAFEQMADVACEALAEGKP